ncbi:MAG: hypothetical protein ABIP77_07085 [Candidatus Limnocylindrales bacterium]
MHPKRPLMSAALAATVLAVTAATFALASPASNVSPTLLARGTYDSFKVMSKPDNGGLYKAEVKAPIDVVVRQHTYAAGGDTGWHAHPYPVYITVTSGTLTFYEYDDLTCTPTVVSVGQGYVDSGHGHLARNETGAVAVDVSVIVAPVGAAFRTELVAPNAYCGF